MRVYGLDSVQSLLEAGEYFFKLIANERAVVLFPHVTEHRDVDVAGLSYQDESQGNALAATVKRGRIDFRFHRHFSDERVGNLVKIMQLQPEMTFAAEFEFAYQGRPINR